MGQIHIIFLFHCYTVNISPFDNILPKKEKNILVGPNFEKYVTDNIYI